MIFETMLDLADVRIFVKVAELASFTRAAEQLRMPKSKASLRLRTLEDEVGSRLLQRTTRAVRLTPDGEQFLVRARRLVADAEEMQGMFEAPSTLRGPVRVDLPVAIAREIVIPRLPELLAQHPQLEILLSTTDRRVEVVREGFDCVLRVGALGDSGLVAKRLGQLRMANYASPDYLRKYGTPQSPDDLDRHYLVQYSLSLGEEPTFEYRDGSGYREIRMRSLVTVNSTDAYAAACAAGLGIIQAPAWSRGGPVARGDILEILADYPCAPLAVTLVQGPGRNAPKRVRTVMTWLAQMLTPMLDG